MPLLIDVTRPFTLLTRPCCLSVSRCVGAVARTARRDIWAPRPTASPPEKEPPEGPGPAPAPAPGVQAGVGLCSRETPGGQAFSEPSSPIHRALLITDNELASPGLGPEAAAALQRRRAQQLEEEGPTITTNNAASNCNPAPPTGASARALLIVENELSAPGQPAETRAGLLKRRAELLAALGNG